MQHHHRPTKPVQPRRLLALVMASALGWLAWGMAGCHCPSPTPVQSATIVETEIEHPRVRVTVQPEITDQPSEIVTATPSASRTPRPTRTSTSPLTITSATKSAPEATPAWANTAETLREISLPTTWIADVDLTGSVTVTHPADWTVSEWGMYELSFLPPRHAWAKVRLVDRPSSISGSSEGLAALAEQVRNIEASRNDVFHVEQALRQEPAYAALVSLYARDPQRPRLLCQVIHVWLPLENDRHVYGILGRYDSIAPALTTDEMNILLMMMVAAARESLPASP